jgi:hypothetical protein
LKGLLEEIEAHLAELKGQVMENGGNGLNAARDLRDAVERFIEHQEEGG